MNYSNMHDSCAVRGPNAFTSALLFGEKNGKHTNENLMRAAFVSNCCSSVPLARVPSNFELIRIFNLAILPADA